MYFEDHVKPHEKVFRLIAQKIENKKPEHWLYHQCKKMIY